MVAPIVNVLGELGTQTVVYMPNIISAIILLVIGLVVGKIVGRVVKEVLTRIKLDYYVTETHKPVISLSDIFALIVRWWIYLAFVAAALSREVLGIPSLAEWMGEITGFIPNVIGAAVIVIVGYVIGEYIRAQMKKMKEIYASLVGKILYFFILYVAVALALPILGIPATLVNNILLVVIGALGLGVAIALGLGLKDAVSEVSKKYVRKFRI
ncbi:MAG: hypothetical protein HZB66_01935 [Candidatus Aenigmarchaeota archaeon]|nr:hypothetical protein [Candidatus Aenigmarchaeota archaeon]